MIIGRTVKPAQTSRRATTAYLLRITLPSLSKGPDDRNRCLVSSCIMGTDVWAKQLIETSRHNPARDYSVTHIRDISYYLTGVPRDQWPAMIEQP